MAQSLTVDNEKSLMLEICSKLGIACRVIFAFSSEGPTLQTFQIREATSKGPDWMDVTDLGALVRWAASKG